MSIDLRKSCYLVLGFLFQKKKNYRERCNDQEEHHKNWFMKKTFIEIIIFLLNGGAPLFPFLKHWKKLGIESSLITVIDSYN